MADLPAAFTIKEVWEAATAFMGALSGAFKKIAPPDSKVWIIVGTLAAAAAYAVARLALAQNIVRLSRGVWIACAVGCILLGFVAVYRYVGNRSERTFTYEGDIKLTAMEGEYLDDVANDPDNEGKSIDDLMHDATGDPADVWTPDALRKSRRILGRGYAAMIFLFALGLYLGIEAYDMPEKDPVFSEKINKLRDVHFEHDKSTLGTDAREILKANAEILKDAFQQFPKATVMLEGYCDDRGNDQYNFNLGYNRADAVRKELTDDGIDAQKLSVTSHGRKDSTCAADDEVCRAKNRRVHLTGVQN
jgi:outer membrane protein OmpA-like peptidoglycan-associated protein